MTSFSHLKNGSFRLQLYWLLGCLWETCRRRVVGSPVDRCAAGVSLTGLFLANNAKHKLSIKFT